MTPYFLYFLYLIWWTHFTRSTCSMYCRLSVNNYVYPSIFLHIHGHGVYLTLSCSIMKRKFKQWWSTIPPISTKQAFTSDLNTLNMKKRLVTMIYDVRNPGPGLWQVHIVGGLYHLMGSPPSPFDNWISNCNTYIYMYNKQTKRNCCKLLFQIYFRSTYVI